MGFRKLIRELREVVSECGYTRVIPKIDELSDLIEDLRRAERGRRRIDSRRIQALLSLLEYAEAVKTARNSR